MQSDDEHCTLHTCFDFVKSAVMGCCYSICHKDSDPQVNVPNERTHLLEVPEQQQETPSPTTCASTPPRKPDEQSALNRILHETATNVIDVGALGPYSLEANAYSERVRAYTARAASAALPPPYLEVLSFVPSKPTRVCQTHDMHLATMPVKLLDDIPPTVSKVILNGPPLDLANKELITNAVKKAAAAISELRVEHHEDLVVPFRVP